MSDEYKSWHRQMDDAAGNVPFRKKPLPASQSKTPFPERAMQRGPWRPPAERR